MYTDEQLAYIVGIAGIVGLLFIAWIIYRTPRSKRPRGPFSPEYDGVVSGSGRLGGASPKVDQRVNQPAPPSIRPLSPERRSRYSILWKNQLFRFVDEPEVAVTGADHLVEEVMKERGYLVDGLDPGGHDVPVDRPQLVEGYRTAHKIVMEYRQSGSNTEDLRRAMIWYRELFRELLGDGSMPARAHHP